MIKRQPLGSVLRSRGSSGRTDKKWDFKLNPFLKCWGPTMKAHFQCSYVYHSERRCCINRGHWFNLQQDSQ